MSGELSLRNVAVRYDTNEVVHDVNLEVASGQVLVVQRQCQIPGHGPARCDAEQSTDLMPRNVLCAGIGTHSAGIDRVTLRESSGEAVFNREVRLGRGRDGDSRRDQQQIAETQKATFAQIVGAGVELIESPLCSGSIGSAA